MARRTELPDDQPGDQEPRQDEEDVDADVAAAQSRQPGVVQEHEQDRDRPQSFEVWAEPVAAALTGARRGGIDALLGDADAAHADGIVPGPRGSRVRRRSTG